VLVTCRRRGERLRVEVRDSGPGIAADDHQVIFQEFVQLGNAERARDKGLGLGLAIVRRLVDLLGHRLELRSAPGWGSVFAIELPAAPPPEPVPGDREALALGHFDGLQVAARRRRRARPRRHVQPARIVGLRSDRRAHGRRAAGRGGERDAPDILITDLRLGGTTDGLALIAAVRSQPGRAELPAVLISGDTAPESLARIQATGVPMLHKPVRPARLRALMHRLLTDH
jgi:CheY-like chemotaxis protein